MARRLEKKAWGVGRGGEVGCFAAIHTEAIESNDVRLRGSNARKEIRAMQMYWAHINIMVTTAQRVKETVEFSIFLHISRAQLISYIISNGRFSLFYKIVPPIIKCDSL
jgi:hypothetical protein